MLTIPELGNTQWSDDHQTLLRQCRQELLDPEYISYQHGNRNTRLRGCNGPMCRKANRDYGRNLQRRIHDAQGQRISAVRRHDEFLDAFIQFATEYHQELGLQPPKRRKLKAVRTYRREHLIPLSTARMLHKGRSKLSGQTS